MTNRFLKKFFGLVLCFALLILTLETASWLALSLLDSDSDPQLNTKTEMFNADGIRDANEFLRNLKVVSEELVEPHPYRWYSLPPNHSSQYHSTDKYGYRIAVDDEEHFKGRTLVGVFGGSTTYSSTTTYEHSLPALLSEQFDSKQFYFKNLGVAGYSSSSELIAFIEATRLWPEMQIAIFYDGVNEVTRAFELYQSPDAPSYYNRSWGYPYPQMLRNAEYNHLFPYARRTNFFPFIFRIADKMLFYLSFYKVPSPKIGQVLSLSKDAARLYIKNIEDISTLARAKGIRTIFVLQPNLYEKDSLTEWENLIISRGAGQILDHKELSRTIYQEIRTLMLARASEMVFIDLSNSLNGCTFTREIFYDNCHLTSEGNRCVASDLSKQLEQHLKPIE